MIKNVYDLKQIFGFSFCYQNQSYDYKIKNIRVW